MVTEADFQRAQYDPLNRKSFVQQVARGETNCHFDGVYYQALVHGDDVMETIPHPSTRHGRSGYPSKIVIYDCVFELDWSLTEFFCALRYHEGEHARQLFERPGFYLNSPEIAEAEAYRNELVQIAELGLDISDEYVRRTLSALRALEEEIGSRFLPKQVLERISP